MTAENGAAPASVIAEGEGRRVVLAGGLDGRPNKPTTQEAQAKPRADQALRADLIGCSCTAAGITATGHAPVLGLCRRLVEAGHDQATPMRVYRGATLALLVRSIGQAARLTVRETTRDGRPRFAPLSSDGRPLVRSSARAQEMDRLGRPIGQFASERKAIQAGSKAVVS
jgi:hypothetical protein